MTDPDAVWDVGLRWPRNLVFIDGVLIPTGMGTFGGITDTHMAQGPN